MLSDARVRSRIAHHIRNLAHPATTSRAEGYLVRYGARALEPLLKACSCRNPKIRYRAVWVLGLIGDRRAYETVFRLSSDPDKAVRYDAAWALGKLGDPRAIAPLIRWMNGADTDPRNHGASEGLADLGKPAIPALIANLEKGSRLGRRTAAYVLGSFGDEACIKPLARLLSSADAHMRIAGIEALAEIEELSGHACSRRWIEQCLNDPAESVRKNAAYWLNALRTSGQK